MPEGTDFNRPSSPEEGVVRYNTTQDALEFYNGTVWGVLNGGTIAGSSVVYKIVVGAYNHNGINSGSVYVYDLDGSNEVKITASDGAATDHFGYSVAVGDSKIAVGVYGDDNASGSVYVYDLDGSNEVKITASDGVNDDEFGYSVAVG